MPGSCGESSTCAYIFEGLRTLQIKDLGHVHKFLDMRAELADDGGCRIDQEEATRELLRAHGMMDANATKTPIDEECYIVLDDDAILLETTIVSGGPTAKAF